MPPNRPTGRVPIPRKAHRALLVTLWLSCFLVSAAAQQDAWKRHMEEASKALQGNDSGQALLALVVSQPMPAQESAPGESGGVAARDTDFTFSLAKTIGQPGTEVSVAVLFARKTRAPNLSRIRARVRYPSAVLKFDRVEDAYLSRRVNMRVQGKEEAANASESVLELNLDLPGAQTAGYPSGQIASVYFKIAADAADQIVPMNPQAWIDDSEITPESSVAQIEPGQVQISKDPVFVSCFFFDH